MQVRQLTPDYATQYLRHRQEALASEPLAFLSSPEDDVATSVDMMRSQLDRAPSSVVFGAFKDGHIIGSIGIYREPKVKAAHKAHIWGMFVARDHRRQGAARALLLAALNHARSHPAILQVHLGVTDTALAARRLYESFGFQRWGTEPRYLHHAGRYVDSHHLFLVLDDQGDQHTGAV